jgi:hypothetical protein
VLLPIARDSDEQQLAAERAMNSKHTKKSKRKSSSKTAFQSFHDARDDNEAEQRYKTATTAGTDGSTAARKRVLDLDDDFDEEFDVLAGSTAAASAVVVAAETENDELLPNEEAESALSKLEAQLESREFGATVAVGSDGEM